MIIGPPPKFHGTRDILPEVSISLLRKWLPAYPVAIAVLGVFVVYELYRATRTGSILLPVLAVVDIVIIVAIVREYRLLRRQRSGVNRAR